MNHIQFLNTWLNKKVDYDGVFAYQCVDVVKQYIDQVYDMKAWIFGPSATIWYESGSVFSSNPIAWKKIPRSNTNKPQQWDIIFRWPSKTNAYGHVAIVDSMINAVKVKVIEQNGVWGGNGEWNNVIRLKEYTLANTIGRYHYKNPLDDMNQAVVEIILHNNSKLYNATSDLDLKNLLSTTSSKIRELYK